MLYLMLVVVFSKIKKKWWFFALVGWGKNTIFECIMIYTTRRCGKCMEVVCEQVIEDVMGLFIVICCDFCHCRNSGDICGDRSGNCTRRVWSQGRL